MIIARIFISTLCLLILFGSSQSTTPECKYEYSSFRELGSVYYCKVIEDLNIESKEAAVIESVDGTHANDKTNEDVIVFEADDKNTLYFPRGLEKIYVSIKGFLIWNGRLRELHQEDLKEYVNLVYLGLFHNDLYFLEDGLFDYNPELKHINMMDCKIFHIDPNVFSQLSSKLYQLWLSVNGCTVRTITNANNNGDVQLFVLQLQRSCVDYYYTSYSKRLKSLEQQSKSIKPCEDFKNEYQGIENDIKQSSFKSHGGLNKRLLKIANDQNCTVAGTDYGVISNRNAEIKSLLDKSVADVNEQVEKMQKADEEKFVDVKKTVGDLKDVLREITVNATIKNSALEASVEVLKEKLDEMQGANAEATYRTNIFMLIMLCITGIALIAFLIGFIREKLTKNSKLDQEKQENQAVEDENELTIMP